MNASATRHPLVFRVVPALNSHPPVLVTARLPSFARGPADATNRLGGKAVAVLGAGSVGGVAIADLARMNLRRLLVVDRKRFKPESVATHQVGPDAIGEWKAEHAARRAAALSPGTEVTFCCEDFRKLSLDVFAGFDYLVLATDNGEAELAAGALARRLGIALVQGAVEGATLQAQVRCFGNGSAAAPCPGCFLGRAEWSAVGQGTAFACDGSTTPLGDEPPTRSVAPLCSLAGDLIALAVLRDVLGLGPGVRDTMLSYSAYTHESVVIPLRLAPDCPCDHRPARRVVLAGQLAAHSLERILAAAALAPAAVNFRIDGLRFCERAACPACGAASRPRRFIAPGAGVPCRCGQTAKPVRYYTHEDVAPEHVGAARLSAALAKLGAADARIVSLAAPGEFVLAIGEKHA